MKMLRFVVVFLIIPLQSYAAFEKVAGSAKSLAMGGTGVAGYDDTSLLFINPAGLASSAFTTIFGEYYKLESREMKDGVRFGAKTSLQNNVVGMGWYRLNKDEGEEQIFIWGFGRRIMEGATGTFISLGGNLYYGRITGEIVSGRSSDSNVAGSLGFVIRPFPVISFGYTIENIWEADFQFMSSDESWQRATHWGFSYFWRNRVIISYQRDNNSGNAVDHYGFSVCTAFPIEIMGGFYDGNITGGISWKVESLTGVVSFSSEGGNKISTSLSLEFMFGGMEGEKLE